MLCALFSIGHALAGEPLEVKPAVGGQVSVAVEVRYDCPCGFMDSLGACNSSLVGSRVLLFRSGRAAPLMSSRVELDGWADFEGVPGGEYRLVARSRSSAKAVRIHVGIEQSESQPSSAPVDPNWREPGSTVYVQFPAMGLEYGAYEAPINTTTYSSTELSRLPF